MLATTQSCAVVGLDGYIVQVEVDISPGLPAFNIVGLPDTAVQEARERVRAAVRNTGCEFPLRRITVNLAPADLRKAGPAYDLPIAVGILLSSEQVEPPQEGAILLGELSLDGSLRHTAGILAMVSVARDQGYTAVYVPAVDAPEAALVEGLHVFPTPTPYQQLSRRRFIKSQLITSKPISSGNAGSKWGICDLTLIGLIFDSMSKMGRQYAFH